MKLFSLFGLFGCVVCCLLFGFVFVVCGSLCLRCCSFAVCDLCVVCDFMWFLGVCVLFVVVVSLLCDVCVVVAAFVMCKCGLFLLFACCL